MSGEVSLETLASNSTTLATNAASQTTAQQTQATQTALQTAAQASLAQRATSGIPSTATPATKTNASAITSVTPVEIVAAVTSKKKWITHIAASNPTTGEIACIIVEDSTGTPVVLAALQPGEPAKCSGYAEFVANPPIEVASGKAINARATGSLGDSWVTVQCFEQA